VYSLSKTSVPANALHEIARHRLARRPRAVVELKDGLYNAAYRIELEDGQTAILKVAPSDHVRVLRYEKEIMRAEVEVNGSPIRVPRPAERLRRRL
jgi:hypothetical protein